jgi:hypothetical protein
MNISKRQLQIKEKLASNFGDLWFENEKFIIVDHDPISDKQKEQIYQDFQSKTGKDPRHSLIDWNIENGKLFGSVDIDGAQEKVHISWFNKKIRVLKQLKSFRTSTNKNTLYRREVIDFRFKKGLLINQRTFSQEFPYVQTGRRLGRPLKPYIRD